MYSPTEAIGRVTCWQRTRQRFDIHRLQLLRVVEGLDVFTATAIACFSSSLRRSPAAAISASLTCSAATVVLSNFALYSRSAASPLALTLSDLRPPFY